MVRCVVEFYGVPRQLLAISKKELELEDNADLGKLIVYLAKTFPKLRGRVIALEEDRLLPSYFLGINGRASVSDLSTRINEGDHILLMTAASGG